MKWCNSIKKIRSLGFVKIPKHYRRHKEPHLGPLYALGCFMVFLYTNQSFAQKDTITNPYFYSYDDKLSVDTFILRTSNEWSMQFGDRDESIKLKPNKKTSLGIAARYDFISVALSYAFDFFPGNKDNDTSKTFWYSFDYCRGQFVQHFDFYYQKGFTLQDKQLPEATYYPDFKSTKIGGSTLYVWNKNFSFRTTAVRSEKQLISAGSFVSSVGYYYTSLNAEDVEDLSSKATFFDMAFSPGYYYNWVIAKNYMISGGATLGAGFTVSDYNGETNTSLLTQGAARLSVGYNAENVYAGINSRVNLLNHIYKQKTFVNDELTYVSFFVGYRFNAPHFVKKTTKDIKDATGL